MDEWSLIRKISLLEEWSGKVVLFLEQYEDGVDLVEDFIRSIENHKMGRSLSNVHVVRVGNNEPFMAIGRRRVSSIFIRATMLSVV